jgi:hypothetical protein
MRIYCALLVIFLLSSVACSSKTTLHFYAAHLSQEEREEVKKNIDDEKFNVIVNTLPFPRDINDNAIVYAPSHNSRERLIPLMESLFKLGFDITTASLLSSNNHSFTENNIGLFLLPEHYIQAPLFKEINSYKIPLVNEYGSTNCTHTTILYLKEPDEFIIEINRWDTKKNDYSEEYIEGKWSLSKDNVIKLKQTSWQVPLLFKRSHYERTDLNGKTEGVKLTPIELTVLGQNRQKVNCIYTISIAM